MKRLRALFVLAVLLVPPAAAAAEPRPAGSPRSEIRFRLGDDLRWARPDWDDSDWNRAEAPTYHAPRERSAELFLPVRTGIYWVRFNLRPTDERSPRPVGRTFFWPRDEPGSSIDTVFMAGPFSFELYWDGRLIHRSGVVGRDRRAEIPGPLDNFIRLPPDLIGSGNHVVALRISSWHYNFHTSKSGFYFALENYADRIAYESRLPILPLIGAAGCVVAAAFCSGLFWFVARRRTFALGAALSLAVAFSYFLIAWRWLHNDTYDWFAPRLTAIAVAVIIACLLQVWLLVEQFSIPHRRGWLAVLGALFAAAWFSSPFHDEKVLWVYRGMLGFAIVATAWAAWHRRVGSRWVLLGAIIGLAAVQPNWDSRSFVSPAFLLTPAAQIICLFIALGLQLREDRRVARQTGLTAARLEIELLKKNIQPHFLLNTLAVLTEIVEQDPRLAAKLIDDLAEEFRTVARISAEKLIPLAQEFELCRAHLRVMSARTSRTWTLHAGEVDPSALVPPAIFLTLIENGFVHQTAPAGNTAFTLTAERLEAGGTRYRFISPGAIIQDAARAPGGTGLRYVKARLEESFPSAWSLWGEAVPDGWQTTIEIRDVPDERAPSGAEARVIERRL